MLGARATHAWSSAPLCSLCLSMRLPLPPRMDIRARTSAPIVVPSSEFSSELSYRTVTASTFAGAPLSVLDGATRGRVLTDFARRCDADLHPGAKIEDAVAGECASKVASGERKRRAQHMAEYDWQRDGKRVACKSAQLTWDGGMRFWKLLFSKVKLETSERPAAFDELLLAAYTPEGVHLFRHDGRAGVSTHGENTHATGQRIQFVGRKGETDWRVAWVQLAVRLRHPHPSSPCEPTDPSATARSPGGARASVAPACPAGGGPRAAAAVRGTGQAEHARRALPAAFLPRSRSPVATAASRCGRPHRAVWVRVGGWQAKLSTRATPLAAATFDEPRLAAAVQAARLPVSAHAYVDSAGPAAASEPSASMWASSSLGSAQTPARPATICGRRCRPLRGLRRSSCFRRRRGRTRACRWPTAAPRRAAPPPPYPPRPPLGLGPLSQPRPQAPLSATHLHLSPARESRAAT